MRFCKNCGIAVDKNDKICVVCGAKIDEEPDKNINDGVAAADSAENNNSEPEQTPVQSENADLEKPEEQQPETKPQDKNFSKDTEQTKSKPQDTQNKPKKNKPKNKPQDKDVSKNAEQPKSKPQDIQNKPENKSESIVDEPRGKNPNRHDEFEDISSFTPATDKAEKNQKPTIAPNKHKKDSVTKVVSSVDEVESKTREVNSVAKAEADEKIEKNKKSISKKAKTFIITCCSVAVIAVVILTACLIMANSGPTAEELFASGQQKYNTEDFYGAITDLSECVKLNTSDVEAYMLLADAYTATGKEDEALSALEIGYRETGSTKIKTRLDALSEKLRVDKIYNNLVSEGNAAIKNNDYNLAITKFTSAIETKPNVLEPYLLVANAYISQENYEKALSVLQSGTDKLEGDELKQLNDKISEVEATIKKIEEEEQKRLEEERKKAEEEQKEKERLEQERLEKLAKQPVAFETKVDETNLDYEDVEIYRGEGRWIDITDDRELPGIEYAKNIIQNTLDSYYEFDKDLYGVKDEKELYNLVKASNNISAISHCRITVTYNKNGILSFVIYKYYMPPTISNFEETIETHTINLQTGDEYYLDDLLNTSDIYTVIKTQSELIGLSLTDEQINSYEFFLAGDELVFWVKIRDWEYEEIPLPYSNTDMFKIIIEEDTGTTYLSLQ